MIESIRKLTGNTAFTVLLALSAAHCLNDLLQSVITAVYPMLKADLHIDFADKFGIEVIYNWCAYMPLLGIVAALLPQPQKNLMNLRLYRAEGRK